MPMQVWLQLVASATSRQPQMKQQPQRQTQTAPAPAPAVPTEPMQHSLHLEAHNDLVKQRRLAQHAPTGRGAPVAPHHSGKGGAG